MRTAYQTLSHFGQAEFIINRSRFIGHASPVNTEEEALAFISSIKKKHWDATHNVWAYILGKDSSLQRFSDDGEPQGTAGIPVLDVLRKGTLVDAAVVVTRYYGGVKLGAGGLVRAYTQGAKVAIDSAEAIEKTLYQGFLLHTEYSRIGTYQKTLIEAGFHINDIHYDEGVHFIVFVPYHEQKKFLHLMDEASAGQDRAEMLESAYLVL